MCGDFRFKDFEFKITTHQVCVICGGLGSLGERWTLNPEMQVRFLDPPPSPFGDEFLMIVLNNCLLDEVYKR